MKFLTAILLVLVSLTALADVCVLPSGVPVIDPITNNVVTTAVTTPIIPAQNTLTWMVNNSPSACTPIVSPANACANLAGTVLGCTVTWNLSLDADGVSPHCNIFCNGTPTSGGKIFASVAGSANQCPSGYTLTGSTCTLTTALSFDAQVLAHSGSTVSRDADGNITGITGGDLANFTVTSFDSLKRATQIVPPNGDTVTYTYVGNTASIATFTDSHGTTSFGYLDPLHVSSITLPDGTIYNLGHSTDANGNAFLNSVGVVHGFVGGTRAGTLAPWGVAIPFVTSSLETPNDKMLALLLEGLEVPEFHAESVGLQPYASILPTGENNTIGDFTIAYADSVANSNSQVYPPVLPGSPMPSACVIAKAGGNQNSYCQMWHGIALAGCVRGSNATYFSCINNVWQAYRAMGC